MKKNIRLDVSIREAVKIYEEEVDENVEAMLLSLAKKYAKTADPQLLDAILAVGVFVGVYLAASRPDKINIWEMPQ